MKPQAVITLLDAARLLSVVQVEGDVSELAENAMNGRITRRQATHGCTLVAHCSGFYIEGETEDDITACIAYALNGMVGEW